MLTATRAFGLSAQSSPPLPRVEELAPLWDWGVTPRAGQVIMIAGRSGSQKSGFALFWTAQMGLPTLYMSADMTPFEATSRLVAMQVQETTEDIEAGWLTDKRELYLGALRPLNVQFSFGSPITWTGLASELEAWVELNNCYPPVVVIDNLMDVEGCESDYVAQQAAMQDFTALARETGSTFIIIHHATDKSSEASSEPHKPPARRDIKNGLSEKPQLTLTVALEPEFEEFRVACVKQRSGKCDASGSDYVRLQAYPSITRFGPRHAVHRKF